MTNDVVKFLALWALIHEAADDGWKAAVARGGASGDRGDFVDGLAAMVQAEKERLKAAVASGAVDSPGFAPTGEAQRMFEEIRLELGEVRARLESMESALDAIRRRLEIIGPPVGR
jgi:hypothetical protein